jgi:reductive dehalogenase
MISPNCQYPGLCQGRLKEPHPYHKLKRVSQPTTKITADVSRADQREHGFSRALRGDLGPIAKREAPRFSKKYPLSAALVHMAEHLIQKVDGQMAENKAPIPEDPAILTRHIKELAYFLRADAIGICELPPYAVYTHTKAGEPIDLKHKYAIAILVDQNQKSFSGSNGSDWLSGSQSFMSYSTTGFIACIMADYIRRLGYPARAHHARDYQVVVPPILLMAGLGEMSRMGDIIVNPFIGPRFKAAVVTTDLPLLPDQPIDFGLQDFCRICQKCARECPSKAISLGDKVMHNGYEKWPLKVEACAKFRSSNPNGSSCGTCIKVCPWTKPDTWYHNLAVRFAQKSGLARRALIWADDILGYGKQNLQDKWWFDLEEVDGKLIIPKDNRNSI